MRGADVADQVGSNSVLDEMPSGISKRAEFWIVLVQRLGYPIVVSGVLAGGFYQLYKDILKPIAATHISTLDTLAESSKSTAKSFESLTAAHQDALSESKRQAELLQQIGTTQHEIKSVLQQGLKIQQSAVGAHEEKQPPGTEE